MTICYGLLLPITALRTMPPRLSLSLLQCLYSTSCLLTSPSRHLGVYESKERKRKALTKVIGHISPVSCSLIRPLNDDVDDDDAIYYKHFFLSPSEEKNRGRHFHRPPVYISVNTE